MDELFVSVHDNYYSFASDDSPPPKAGTSSWMPLEGTVDACIVSYMVHSLISCRFKMKVLIQQNCM